MPNNNDQVRDAFNQGLADAASGKSNDNPHRGDSAEAQAAAVATLGPFGPLVTEQGNRTLANAYDAGYKAAEVGKDRNR